MIINDTVIVAIISIIFLTAGYMTLFIKCDLDVTEKILHGCLFGLTILGIFIQGILAQM